MAQPATEESQPERAMHQSSPVTNIDQVALRLNWWQQLLKKLKFSSYNSLEESVVELIEEHDPEREMVGEEERALLHNLLRFHEIKVEDIMVPRTDIVAIEDKASLEDIRGLVIKMGHTRLPVYHETLDDIRGFVHVKDLFTYFGTDKPFRLQDNLRKALIVPPSMRTMDLLVKMRFERVHLAIVVDEYGGTDGLVSIEDIMEELVGDISDEHDDVEEPELIQLDEYTWEAKARLDIEVLESKLGVSLRDADNEDDYDTLGGLIFTMLGRVPVKGERIAHPSGVEFKIVEADPRRIRRVLIRYQAVV